MNEYSIKQIFGPPGETSFMNNWDKGVAPAICPCIFGIWQKKEEVRSH